MAARVKYAKEKRADAYRALVDRRDIDRPREVGDQTRVGRVVDLDRHDWLDVRPAVDAEERLVVDCLEL